MQNFVTIAIGGAAGALARHGVNLACRRWLGEGFAYGTLAVNVFGCFMLGLFVTLASSSHGAIRWAWLAHPAVTVGFIGALTTFSTFGFETIRFSQSAQHHLAIANVAANLLLGGAAILAGMALARHYGA